MITEESKNAGVATDNALAAGSVCSNCVYWEGIEELGSYIEGTCFAMMRVTGYVETCDEFSPNKEITSR